MNLGELHAGSMFIIKSEIPEVASGIQFQNEDMSFQVTCFQLLLIIGPGHLLGLMLCIPESLDTVRE